MPGRSVIPALFLFCSQVRPFFMLKGKVVIGGVVGLHARPASGFVQVAERYASEIRLVKDGMRVNGKSILAILTLAASKGSTVGLEVYGEDEKEAFEALRRKLETLDQDEA